MFSVERAAQPYKPSSVPKDEDTNKVEGCQAQRVACRRMHQQENADRRVGCTY
jgi:hypothetical protein